MNAAKTPYEMRKALVLAVDDHAFDGDAWRCGCGYSSGGTPLGVLRDHRRHVADIILDLIGLEHVGWKQMDEPFVVPLNHTRHYGVEWEPVFSVTRFGRDVPPS